jgi:HK97 family phage prohead protease
MKNHFYNLKESFEIKDIDTGTRQVAVYLSKFDAMDSDNDVIKKGAFKKSIKERGVSSMSNRKIAFLRHHDWEKQIGKFVDLSEDNYGLYGVGQLGRSTDGEDAFRDYEDGIIKEHSIGFQYITDKIKFVKDETMKGGGYNEIKELILWEGSAVTFGANEHTHVVGMKGQEKTDHIENISKELNLCIRALTNGNGTDERLHELEMKIKYLNSQLILLAINDPVVDQSTEIKSKEIIKAFDWNEVIQKMNK